MEPRRWTSSPRSRRCVDRALLLAAALLACFNFKVPLATAENDEQLPTFEKSVRPLLTEKCIRCHGEKTKKADLDLSTPAGIRRGSESGLVIVPGKPAESRLFAMIHEGKMPPGK